MDGQAEAPDEVNQFQVIGQRQRRVEAPLEQDAAAAVVLEFREFGRKLVPTQDVAVAGPGRPVKSAEAAAGNADVGVVDIPVDDEGDAVAGIETPAHLIGRGPQGEEVQVPQFLRLGRIETSVLFQETVHRQPSITSPSPQPSPHWGRGRQKDSLIPGNYPSSGH